MNREIKFRGKCSHCDAWAYGNLVDYGEGEAPEIHGFDPYREGDDVWREITVDADTVGQFTGMTDKNGAKIFEGDVVKVYDDANNDTDIGVVKYNEDFGKYIVVYSQVSGNWFDFEGTDGEFLAAFCSEVIGNIHDNPELLSTK